MLRITRRFSSVKLHHLSYENKKPWDLVVLHGLLGSHKNFRTLMKNRQLNQKVNIHMVDNRNHGESPHTQHHSYDLMAKDLKEFIEQKRLGKVILMGHSMGAGVVYTFSSLFPEMQKNVKQLIVLDMPPRPSEKRTNEEIITGLANIDLSQPKEKVMKQIEAIGKNKTISQFLKTNLRAKDSKLEWVANIPVLKENYPNIVRQIISRPTEWTNSIDIMFGDRSNVCNKQQCLRLREFYENFTEDNIHQIENAGHWLHFDNPTQFTDTLVEIVGNNTG